MKMPLRTGSVVITGLGVQSSLGGVTMACAASRAGITRLRELEDFPVLADDGSQENARGHPVLSVTGFRGNARLLSLGWAALEDLLRQQPGIRKLQPDRTGLLLCLPSLKSRQVPERTRTLHLQHFEDESLIIPPSSSPGGRDLCARLTQLGRLSVPEANWADTCSGHAGLALMISFALESLRTYRLSQCLIGALDSLVEPAALEWLHGIRRLKLPDKPDGIIPGEAGVFILLERIDEAQRRGVDALATVTQATVAYEPHHLQSGRPSTAKAQAQAFSQVLEMPHAPLPAEVWLLSDHNGETYRAHEWGCLLMRLGSQFPSVRVNATWLPAISFGDTGAASMALSACMAVRAFTRGYHPAPTALLSSSSDTGLRGAVRIESRGTY